MQAYYDHVESVHREYPEVKQAYNEYCAATRALSKGRLNGLDYEQITKLIEKRTQLREEYDILFKMAE